jgi:serine/threonine protein kinase
MTVRQPEPPQNSPESPVLQPLATGTGPSNDTMVGRLLRGTYRIVAALDEGGMGKLYRAEHQRLRRPVAVKVMASYLSANKEALARFRREAEIVSQLDHPHIVHILDFDTTETGEPYIVMELLQGETLSHRLDQQRILPLRDTVAIVSQVASALTAAHRAGVVHRDLKPDNVFLLSMRDESMFSKLLDFGISKGSPKSTRVTGKYDVLGTPDYMAPEQALDTARADHHADQWSLACITYEMLTGRVPFCGDSAVQILAKVVSEPPPPLTQFVPNVPQPIQDVVLRGLSKDPFQRFPTIGDFAERLARAAQEVIASDQSLTESGARPAPNPLHTAPTLSAKPRQRTTKPQRVAAKADADNSRTKGDYCSVAPERVALSGRPPPAGPAQQQQAPRNSKPISARLRGSAPREEAGEDSTRGGSARIRRTVDQRPGRQAALPAVAQRQGAVALSDTKPPPNAESAESMLKEVEAALAKGAQSLAVQSARAALRLTREAKSQGTERLNSSATQLLLPVLLEALGGKDRTVSLAHKPSSDDGSLSPAHMFLVSRIDQATTVEEIMDVSPLSHAETLGILLDFRDEGVLTVD